VKREGAAAQRERPVHAGAPASAVVAVPRGPPEGVAVQHGQPAAVMPDARPVWTVAVVPDTRPLGTVAVVPHGPDEGAAVRA